MRQEVTSTQYATSSKEQTGDLITFTQFEEGNIWTETCNDAESGDESDNESIMVREQNIENINSYNESDHDFICMEMLEGIREEAQTHTNVNKREAGYEIRDRIRQKK